MVGMADKVMHGRNFIKAMKPMLGLNDASIVSMTIKADCRNVVRADVEVLGKNANVNLEAQYITNEDTITKRYIFEVTEITDSEDG